MGEVVNLNKYRKLKARKEKAKQAEKNRLKHAMSPAERSLRDKKKELEMKRLEGHKLDQGDKQET